MDQVPNTYISFIERMLCRVVLHYAVVLDRLLNSCILLHHLPPSPLP